MNDASVFFGLLLSVRGEINSSKYFFFSCNYYNCFGYAKVGGNEHLWLNGVYDSAVVIFVFPSNYFLGSERRD
jgi:hypothetical protein